MKRAAQGSLLPQIGWLVRKQVDGGQPGAHHFANLFQEHAQ